MCGQVKNIDLVTLIGDPRSLKAIAKNIVPGQELIKLRSEIRTGDLSRFADIVFRDTPPDSIFCPLLARPNDQFILDGVDQQLDVNHIIQLSDTGVVEGDAVILDGQYRVKPRRGVLAVNHQVTGIAVFCKGSRQSLRIRHDSCLRAITTYYR